MGNSGRRGVLGFELITVEVNDFFRRLGLSQGLTNVAAFREALILAFVWIVYGSALVWYGQRKRNILIHGFGQGVSALAIVVGAAAGIAFQPAASFVPIVNGRFAVFAVLIAAVVLQGILAKRNVLWNNVTSAVPWQNATSSWPTRS